MPYVSNGIYYVASGDSEFGNIPRGSNGAYSNGSMYKTEVVNSGGAIYNQNILDSGSVIVSSGGRTFGTISIASGGKVEYANGSITSATVEVSSGGSLIIDPGAQQYVGGNYVLNGGTVT
ncbi:Hint domain-containing protein, partial [Acetobacter pasteurianus]